MLTVNVVKGKIEAHTPMEYDSLKMMCILWQKFAWALHFYYCMKHLILGICIFFNFFVSRTTQESCVIKLRRKIVQGEIKRPLQVPTRYKAPTPITKLKQKYDLDQKKTSPQDRTPGESCYEL